MTKLHDNIDEKESAGPALQDETHRTGEARARESLSAGDSAMGLVLAGGLSTRFGSDKSDWQIDGESLVHRMCRLVLSAAGNVTVSVRHPEDAPADVPFVVDHYPGEGPLAGLHAGLSAAAHEWVLVVPCDMPLLNSTDLLLLLQDRDHTHEAVIATDRERRTHPLCGCYRRSVLAVVEEMLGGEERAVHRLIDQLRVKTVLLPSRSLTNINRPSDLPD